MISSSTHCATIEAMTSSASVPGTSAIGMPRADTASKRTGSCSSSSGGVSVPRTSSTIRCALYSGRIAVRKSGRQSASMTATTRVEPHCWTSCAIVSRRPRTAFTGRPCGDRMVSGRPWNDR